MEYWSAGVSMDSQQTRERLFRHSGESRNPVFLKREEIRHAWTPFFNGVTAFKGVGVLDQRIFLFTITPILHHSITPGVSPYQ